MATLSFTKSTGLCTKFIYWYHLSNSVIISPEKDDTSLSFSSYKSPWYRKRLRLLYNYVKQLCLFQTDETFMLQLALIRQYGCFKLVHFSKSQVVGHQWVQKLSLSLAIAWRTFNRFCIALHQPLTLIYGGGANLQFFWYSSKTVGARLLKLCDYYC